MFRVRRIHDDIVPGNRQVIEQVQALLGKSFSAAPAEDITGIADKLRDPFKQRFRSILYVAENGRGRVLGFALVMHEPRLQFSYLDFIATSTKARSRGIGAALYERVRDEAVGLDAHGVFFECLPDDIEACPEPGLIGENRARMRFYERYGARPVIGTAYETPIAPDDSCMPHLVYDGLDRGRPLGRDFARNAVRAILERKYSRLCPPAYVEKVVGSFVDDPIRLRPPRYWKTPPPHRTANAPPVESIALIVNERHDIHHVRERGYVEAPARIGVIRAELERAGLVELLPARRHPISHIEAVHDRALVAYLRRACAATPPGRSVYPYVFPIRNAARPPRELSVQAGYYCIDTFTPINENAYPAARGAVDCALTAADEVLRGRRVAYALVRPPGHHAERKAFGGFCYFNNAAIAAHYLSRHGRVALLDVDYHHGNGQQDIFWTRADVLTISIHGHPSFAYPYFSGFADERGEGEGEGRNLNLPLAETLDGPAYRRALKKAIGAMAEFDPVFLVIALGLDPAKGDPTGTWSLTAGDFEANGALLGAMRKPTLVVQEGGYRTRTLGVNARRFLGGLARASAEAM